MATHAGEMSMVGGRDAPQMWVRLGVMSALSFVVMYALMYAMVNTWADVYLNINKAYMAVLMTAPMVIIELAVMGSMYPLRGKAAVIAIASVVLVLAFGAIRQQQLVVDDAFLRSMIPHHSAAILMCREANITDAEWCDLCGSIMRSQQSEIDQMNRIMDRRGR